MKTIYLVRHGESVANTQVLVCGQMDSPLTELGRAQALALKKLVAANIKLPLRIVSSPLIRAFDTAKLSTGHASIEVDSELMEINTGSMSPWTYDALFTHDARFRKLSENLDLPFENGESVRQLHARVSRWIKARIAEEGDLLVYSHAYAINCILHEMLEEPLSLYPKFALPNACLIKLQFEGQKLKSFAILDSSAESQ